MPEEKEFDSLLEELEDLGVKRNPKSKRRGLSILVEDFLETCLMRPDNFDKMSNTKQRECETEMRGFYKAQERLRELIAVAGTDAIANLADIRVKQQMRPQNLAFTIGEIMTKIVKFIRKIQHGSVGKPSADDLICP